MRGCEVFRDGSVKDRLGAGRRRTEAFEGRPWFVAASRDLRVSKCRCRPRRSSSAPREIRGRPNGNRRRAETRSAAAPRSEPYPPAADTRVVSSLGESEEARRVELVRRVGAISEGEELAGRAARSMSPTAALLELAAALAGAWIVPTHLRVAASDRLHPLIARGRGRTAPRRARGARRFFDPAPIFHAFHRSILADPGLRAMAPDRFADRRIRPSP